MRSETQAAVQSPDPAPRETPPTEKQQRFAQAIAIRLRLNLPGWSKDQYSRFISAHINDFYAREPMRSRPAVSYRRPNDIPERDDPPPCDTGSWSTDCHGPSWDVPDDDSDVHIGPP